MHLFPPRNSILFPCSSRLAPDVDGNVDRVQVDQLLEPDRVHVLHAVTFCLIAVAALDAVLVPSSPCGCLSRVFVVAVVASPFPDVLALRAEPLVQP